jgi:hypothetical protein
MKFTKTCKNDPDLNQCDRGLTVVAQRCLAIDDASDQDRSWPEADLSGCLRRGPFLTPTDVAWDKNGRRSSRDVEFVGSRATHLFIETARDVAKPRFVPSDALVSSMRVATLAQAPTCTARLLPFCAACREGAVARSAKKRARICTA